MLSVSQITALAPDAASVAAGRTQAQPRKWQDLGQAGTLLWGLIQGSGKTPYQTAVDFEAPAYHCSCPSRKFPCKHSLGLMLLAAEAGIGAGTPPDWVEAWRDKRAASADKKRVREEVVEAASSAPAVKEATVSAQRLQRLQRMSDGLAQTQFWLEDLIGQGLGWARAQPLKYWTDQLARLTNDQLPGVAAMVDDCYRAAHLDARWDEQLLAALCRVHLLCRTWQRRDQLDDERRAELDAAAGIPTSKELVLSQTSFAGTWQVLARVLETRDNLRSYRHWLWCRENGRLAQVVEYAAGAQALDTSLPTGALFDGEIVYYPGTVRLRALIKKREPASRPAALFAVANDLAFVQRVLGSSWSAAPWQRLLPAMFRATPRADLGGFVDAEGRFASWLPMVRNPWPLVALSGGAPLSLFGEWSTFGFAPLAAVSVESGAVWVAPDGR